MPDNPTEPITLARVQALLDGSPYIRFYGMRAVSIDPAAGTVVIAAELRPELERRGGVGQWHGGALSGLIDTVGDFAVVLTAGAPVPTINLRVDYLRPATTPSLLATARLRRAGRMVAVVDIELADAEGRLVAIGRGCYGSQPG